MDAKTIRAVREIRVSNSKTAGPLKSPAAVNYRCSVL